MILIQCYIPELLKPWVKCFWCLSNLQTDGAPYTEEILPDNHPEIVFHLNSTAQRKRSGAEHWTKDPDVYFSGQHRRSYTQVLQPGAVLYGIRFHPHTQPLLYNFPASLATDSVIAMDDIVGNDVLKSCIDESPQRTFANFQREVSKKLSSLRKVPQSFPYVDAAVRRIIHHQGNIRMNVLQKITGVSERHLEKEFERFVGLTPKQFSNIVRFGYFINYRKYNPAKTLTECAHETNFHDQSHLIRLSKLITGQSPKDYFKRLNHINNYFLEP